MPIGASLRHHVNGDVRFGSGNPTSHEADADPCRVPHLSPRIGHPTAADIAEARDRVTEAEHLCHPAQAAVIAAWCGRLRSLPFAPGEESGVQFAIAAIILACDALPAAVWTVDTVTLALRTFKRWPAPAEVFALLDEQAQSFLRSRDGLRRVATATPAPPPRPPPKRSQEARDAVQSVVAAFAAERMYHRSGPASDEAKPKPAPLSHGVLITMWEQAAKDGVPGAALRVEMLRKQLRGAVSR